VSPELLASYDSAAVDTVGKRHVNHKNVRVEIYPNWVVVFNAGKMYLPREQVEGVWKI